jgi:hypothetical protein
VSDFVTSMCGVCVSRGEPAAGICHAEPAAAQPESLPATAAAANEHAFSGLPAVAHDVPSAAAAGHVLPAAVRLWLAAAGRLRPASAAVSVFAPAAAQQHGRAGGQREHHRPRHPAQYFRGPKHIGELVRAAAQLRHQHRRPWRNAFHREHVHG